ncbi:hypothetical protein A9Q87_10800 [Flavobacteriales bacterium 34_180_T64]|nr:hypothetical protein A9Q87_10800 [Flavobacteriales bacterium 34_180_T64]
MQFLLKKHKLILTLVAVFSLVTFSGIASTTLPFQVQTELTLTNAPKDVHVFYFVEGIKLFQTLQLNNYIEFDFDCFLNHFKHKALTSFKSVVFNHNDYKRDLELILINQETSLKEDPLQI